MPSFVDRRDGQYRCQMSDNDVLVDLLGHPEIKMPRKPESVPGRLNGDSDHDGGYDLTNPNLHHGVEDIYRPFQSSEQPRSGSLVETDASPVAVSKTVDLEAGDSGPTATAIANQTAYEGKPLSFDVSSYFAAPAAGNTLTFSGSMPAGLMIDAHTGVISGVPTDSDFGNHLVTVTATDAHGVAISETVRLQVDDSGPTATAIANQIAYEGKAFSLDVSSHFAAPAAGDSLTFSGTMPAGLKIDPHTGIISGVPTDNDFGNNTITVTATDAHGKAISETFQLQVDDSGPTATAIANQSAFEGKAFSLNVSSHFAAPAAGDTLTFSGSMPAGLSLNAHTGVISGVPTDSDFGNNTITVTATDAHGKAISESFQLQVGDSGPTATAIANQSAFEGQAFSLNVSSHFAAPAAGDALTFSAKLPAGLSIECPYRRHLRRPDRQRLRQQPDHGDGDRRPRQGDQRELPACGRRQRPDRNRHRKPERLRGQSLLAQRLQSLRGSGGRRHPDLLGRLPAGLSLNAHTGVISGVPTDSDFGNNTITVTATDAHGKAISETFQLQVGDSGPTATAIANQSAYEGKAFSLNVSSHFAAPAAGDTLTFSGSMPAGLSLNAHTGVISGVPTDSDFGNNTITRDGDRCPRQDDQRELPAPGRRQRPDRNGDRKPERLRGQGLLAQRLQSLRGSGGRRHPDLLGLAAGWPQPECPYRRHLRRADRQRLRQQHDHA